MTHHGQLYLRDGGTPRSIYYEQGKFGRMFPSLPPFAQHTDEVVHALMGLGSIDGPMNPKDDLEDPQNIDGDPSNVNNENRDEQGRIIQTAGMTFLGQFLDHDITFDPTSSLGRQVDPEAVSNFRTPAFELDSVYGSGLATSPYLYDRYDVGKFLIDIDGKDIPAIGDLPRNSQNRAIIADPRNDENLMLSGLHLAILKFHNETIEFIRDNSSRKLSSGEVFEEAQKLVRWHYQWIILNEFLPKTVGQDLVDDILSKGRKCFNWRNEPFIPMEFSVAAYRFGHSQVRPGYVANHFGNQGGQFTAPIFDYSLDALQPDPEDLRGGKRAKRRFIDWNTFFDFQDGKAKPNKLIDTKLSSRLFLLPFPVPGLPGREEPVRSLAQRNLIRHLDFGLPSGQAVARALGVEELSGTELKTAEPFGLHKSTPLWFYILAEAEARHGGLRLGELGGRLVAEVFIGLIQGDAKSYLSQHPTWTPTFAERGEFQMTNLLSRAGLAPSKSR